eukprot:765069-Hanusia_phi.AAC.6
MIRAARIIGARPGSVLGTTRGVTVTGHGGYRAAAERYPDRTPRSREAGPGGAAAAGHRGTTRVPYYRRSPILASLAAVRRPSPGVPGPAAAVRRTNLSGPPRAAAEGQPDSRGSNGSGPGSDAG